MFTLTTFTIACILLASLIAAGWPLVVLPRVRAAVLCAGGTCCVAGGTTVVGLLAAGLIGIPGVADRSAAAQEKPQADAASAPAQSTNEAPASQSPAKPSSSSTGSGSQGLPAAPTAADAAPATTAAAPAKDDPQIESPPDGKIVYPPGRPNWVETPANTTGAKLHTIPVSSGPWKRHADAQRALDQALKSAADDYIADQLGSLLAPKFISYDARTIKQRFVKPENIYDESVIFPELGPMQQSQALLEFGPEFRAELDRKWTGVRADWRLAQLGLFAGAGLLLVGAVFSYFRLDNATRGYYTGRLQFMTAAAILAIVGAGAVLARWITWM